MIPKDAHENSPISRNALFAICGMLMLASAINYMDRQTLAAVSKRITTELNLSETQYGNVETAFGLSFAAGSVVFGVLSDYVSVRWLYPVVLALWSLMGFLTGFVESYEGMILCRALLGFFEAGHWPCGLKTTQAILGSKSRAMGNSVLQSGTSIGAILTPLFMIFVLRYWNDWRIGFQVVGAFGVLWLVGWVALVRQVPWSNTPRESSNDNNQDSSSSGEHHFWTKLIVVLIVVTTINISWQILRAWLPKYLQTGLSYTETQSLAYTSIWFFCTDIGCILAGMSALALSRRGYSIKVARGSVFAVCALLCSLISLVPFMPNGPIRLVALAIAGAGALGMFPLYYSFSQDVTKHHMGKVVAITGICAWSIPTQSMFGALYDRFQTYDYGLMITGALPLIGCAAILLFWPNVDETSDKPSPQ